MGWPCQAACRGARSQTELEDKPVSLAQQYKLPCPAVQPTVQLSMLPARAPSTAQAANRAGSSKQTNCGAPMLL